MTVKCYTPGSTEFNPASGMWQQLHRAMPSVLTMSGSFHEYDRTASLNLVYPGEKKKNAYQRVNLIQGASSKGGPCLARKKSSTMYLG